SRAPSRRAYCGLRSGRRRRRPRSARESGFWVRPLVEMQRAVDAGGQPVTAAFTIARVGMGEMPEGRIQILTHRPEPLFGPPRRLSHPTGARALTRLLVAVAAGAGAVRRPFPRPCPGPPAICPGDRPRPGLRQPPPPRRFPPPAAGAAD